MGHAISGAAVAKASGGLDLLGAQAPVVGAAGVRKTASAGTIGLEGAEIASSVAKADRMAADTLRAAESSPKITITGTEPVKALENAGAPYLNIGRAQTAKDREAGASRKKYNAIVNSSEEYLNNFIPSPSPLELVQSQADQPTKVAYIRIDHILNGEVKTYRNGQQAGSGGHYLRDPNVRVDKITGVLDNNGVSTGYISIRDSETGKWVPKKAETSFFPEHWSKRQTVNEIKSAFENSSPMHRSTERWQGISKSGLEIEGFYGKPDGNGATAWPVYEGK